MNSIIDHQYDDEKLFAFTQKLSWFAERTPFGITIGEAKRRVNLIRKAQPTFEEAIERLKVFGKID